MSSRSSRCRDATGCASRRTTDGDGRRKAEKQEVSPLPESPCIRGLNCVLTSRELPPWPSSRDARGTVVGGDDHLNRVLSYPLGLLHPIPQHRQGRRICNRRVIGWRVESLFRRPRLFEDGCAPSIAEPVPKWTGPPVQTKRRRETSAAFLLSPQGFAGLAVSGRVSGRAVVITSRAVNRGTEPPNLAKVSESLRATRARVMTGLISL